MTRAGAVAGLLLSIACASPGDSPRDSTESSAVDEGQLFDERVAVFLLADSAAIADLRASYGEDDRAVIGDDMMWYRAEAFDRLEQHGIRTVTLEGRPPLRFMVDGSPAPFEYPAETTLDLVVLYEPGRAPIAVAPVDVTMQVPAWFSAP